MRGFRVVGPSCLNKLVVSIVVKRIEIWLSL